MDRFTIEQLNQTKFIKENNLKEITNPVIFDIGNTFTPDGLLSNEIFGLTKEERSGIFAYIDLKQDFIQPYYYKIWLKIDKNIRGCIYETDKYIIDKDGYLVQDDNGQCGIKFLKNNIDSINFKKTKKDELLRALLDGKAKNNIFTSKLIVIPPYYRDVNTNSSGRVGVGEVNKLYINLLNNTKALSESNEFGLDLTGNIRGRIQDLLLELYNWFTIGETEVGGVHTGSGIFKKFGLQRRSVMAKTTDYSARLVLSQANTNVNSKEDLMVDLDYSAVPLSAACVIAYPFIINFLRSYFDNEFGGKIKYPLSNGDSIELLNPQIEFSDDRFDKELNEFIHGYSNRFKPILIPNKQGLTVKAKFKGYYITEEQYKSGIRENDKMIERDITWLDILYQAACSVTEDKCCMITRYPIDSYFNHLYTKVHISSTKETEPMVINGKFYKWYPKIRDIEIGKDTSNKFIDTLQLSNAYCGLMGADYDGDQVTIKMAYSDEANKELEKYRNSNAQFITFSGSNGRKAEKEAIQALYSMTLVLPEDKSKLTDTTNIF